MFLKKQTTANQMAVAGDTAAHECNKSQFGLPSPSKLDVDLNKAVNATAYKVYASKMDMVRVFAIASIVWGHALIGWEKQAFTGWGQQALQAMVMQLGRLGTISFFIITGFFFSGKLKSFTVPAYLRYRFFSLILPWFIFIAIVVSIQLVQILSIKKVVLSNTDILILLSKLVTAAIFHAAFWFIPVSIISACLLVACKKCINSLWFGMLLGCITLFYCVNLYYGWVSANHTKSFLGYVFFMWLGVQCNVHLVYIKALNEKLKWRFLLPALAITFLLACREAWLLKSIGCIDPFASIRFSNAIVSVLVFFAVLKIRKVAWVEKTKPHRYIYGVYLVHTAAILELMPLLNKFAAMHHLFVNMPFAVLFQVFVFGCIMLGTYGIVVAIKSSPFRFIIGRA